MSLTIVREKATDLIFKVGTDVTNILGITHYESNIDEQGDRRAELPYGIPKTDEERHDNLSQVPYGELVDVTLKIDGQSWTAFYNVDTDEFGTLFVKHFSVPSNILLTGVTSRRCAFSPDVENSYTAHVKTYDIDNKLKEFCKENGVSLCLRGETYGQGIQNLEQNPHCKVPHDLAIFSVYCMNTSRHTYREDEYYFSNVCALLNLPMVPILESGVPLTEDLIKKCVIFVSK